MSGFTRSAKKYLVKCLATKQPLSFLEVAAKDSVSYSVRHSWTFGSKVKCKFLALFGKIYYETSFGFIFTFHCLLLKQFISFWFHFYFIMVSTAYFAYCFLRFCHHFSFSCAKYCLPKFHNLGKLLFKVPDTYSLTTRFNRLTSIVMLWNEEKLHHMVHLLRILSRTWTSEQKYFHIRHRRIYWKVVGKIRIAIK